MATATATPFRWARFTWDDIGEGRDHLLVGEADADGNHTLACGRVRDMVPSSISEVDAEPSENVHSTCALVWAGIKVDRAGR